MLKRASIALIGALFAFSSLVFIEPAQAAPCTPTSTTSGSSVVLRFTTVGSCTWTVPAGLTSISILIVGGGGGGGGDAAGGGGGGGVYINPSLTINSSTKTIQVGGGGVGGQCSSGNSGSCTAPPLASAGYIAAMNGETSTFDLISVPGGGKGGVYNSGAGGNGGSGGGGAAAGGSGGTSTISGSNFYGNSGGASNGAGGGGGGGAGQVGGTGAPGSGGNGISSSITGVSTFYGGGGGGGGSGTRGTGGNGGGGAGALSCTYPFALGTDSNQAIAGSPNTGGGGGGAPYGCPGSGAAGGSGVVIIAYTLIPTITSLALSTGLKSAIYRTNNTIQVTLSSDGRVRFYVNGKQIPGCISVLSSSLVSSCTWKPSIRGNANLTAKVVGGTSTLQLAVNVLTRTGRR